MVTSLKKAFLFPTLTAQQVFIRFPSSADATLLTVHTMLLSNLFTALLLTPTTTALQTRKIMTTAFMSIQSEFSIPQV